MNELKIYSGLSFLSASIVLGSAYTKGDYRFLDSKFNVLILVNFAYNILFLFGKLIQHIFFGTLRDVESKKLYDRLLQYILFKIMFIGATIDSTFNDLIIWIGWFSVLGFMKIFSLLTRDRFEYITTFPNTRTTVHRSLLILLILLLAFDIAWFSFGYSFCTTIVPNISVFLLLTFECFTLFLETIQTLVKYVIYLIDLSKEQVWEQRGTYTYYTEFITDTLILTATLGHYLHILTLHSISFTLIDALLFLHMRMVFNNLKEKLVAYKNYRQLAQNMKERYPDVSKEELQALDDVCPICHDKLESAKKLPCGHIFHHSCLRAWLENNHNCPTCRYTLIDTPSQRVGPAPLEAPRPNIGVQIDHNQEELFRFNAPRWFSWLPAIHIVRNHPGPAVQSDQIPPDMVQRVQEILPQVPADRILRDLMQTRSIDLTIENLIAYT